jgi:hypothetical protein
VTLFADVVAAAGVAAATTKRTEKRDALAELLGGLHADEVEPVVGFLLGEARQGRIGIGWAAIRDLDCPPAAEPSLTVGEVDAAIDLLAATTGTGSQGERRRQLVELFGRATAAEADLLGRLFVGEMRTGALAGVLTDAAATASVPHRASRQLRCAGPRCSPATSASWPAPPSWTARPPSPTSGSSPCGRCSPCSPPPASRWPPPSPRSARPASSGSSTAPASRSTAATTTSASTPAT